MKYIIMILLISSFLRASNHYGINFTNDEESATTFNINHSTYQYFKDLKFSSTHARDLVKNRPYIDLTDLLNNSSTTYYEVLYLKYDAINHPNYGNDLLLTIFEFKFLMALSGILFSSILFYLISSFLIGL